MAALKHFIMRMSSRGPYWLCRAKLCHRHDCQIIHDQILKIFMNKLGHIWRGVSDTCISHYSLDVEVRPPFKTLCRVDRERESSGDFRVAVGITSNLHIPTCSVRILLDTRTLRLCIPSFHKSQLFDRRQPASRMFAYSNGTINSTTSLVLYSFN